MKKKISRKNSSKKERENKFVDETSELLSSISEDKKALRTLKNQRLKSLDLREKKEIMLIKEKIKKERLGVLERFEQERKNMGKVLLRKKKQELGDRLSTERRSLNQTNKKIGKIGRELRKF